MLPTLDFPEIVFGLCSPIGTDNVKVSRLLSAELLRFDYKSVRVKVTDMMKSIQLADQKLVDDKGIVERYDTYIKYANRIRELFDDPGVLAMLCSIRTRAHRREVQQQPDAFCPQTAYIFDQFKRREEIERFGKFTDAFLYSFRCTPIRKPVLVDWLSALPRIRLFPVPRNSMSNRRDHSLSATSMSKVKTMDNVCGTRSHWLTSLSI